MTLLETSAAAGVVAWQLQRLWVWPLAWLVIAARQHALLIVMHDAAHYLLLGKSQFNDVIADFCCASPLA